MGKSTMMEEYSIKVARFDSVGDLLMEYIGEETAIGLAGHQLLSQLQSLSSVSLKSVAASVLWLVTGISKKAIRKWQVTVIFISKYSWEHAYKIVTRFSLKSGSDPLCYGKLKGILAFTISEHLCKSLLLKRSKNVSSQSKSFIPR